jgi:hypothetical protein
MGQGALIVEGGRGVRSPGRVTGQFEGVQQVAVGRDQAPGRGVGGEVHIVQGRQVFEVASAEHPPAQSAVRNAVHVHDVGQVGIRIGRPQADAGDLARHRASAKLPAGRCSRWRRAPTGQGR